MIGPCFILLQAMVCTSNSSDMRVVRVGVRSQFPRSYITTTIESAMSAMSIFPDFGKNWPDSRKILNAVIGLLTLQQRHDTIWLLHSDLVVDLTRNAAFVRCAYWNMTLTLALCPQVGDHSFAHTYSFIYTCYIIIYDIHILYYS